ncbi:hypothetical protein HY490_04810 [Candidatus Woesearchaeota archaeon]|nr:hypothetical protein [Candidatus Woesearchaeota archaeon]
MHIECTDRTCELLIQSGIGQRVINEIYSDKKVAYDPDKAYLPRELRALGRCIYQTLKLTPQDMKQFPNPQAFYLALGAFFAGEYPQEGVYSWRCRGRKTYVSSLEGTVVIINQITSLAQNKTYVQDDGQTMDVHAEYWPEFLLLALQHFHCTHPDVSIEDYVDKHWDEYSPMPVIPEEEEGHDVVVEPEASDLEDTFNLDSHTLHNLREFLALPTLPLTDPLRTIPLIGDTETYFPFYLDTDLHFGRVTHPGERALVDAHTPLHQVSLRDWIMITPGDAEHLLLAVFDQYPYPREEGEEVIKFYNWQKFLQDTSLTQ